MESGCLSIYSKHIQALGYCESFSFNECHGKSALDKSEMFATTITSERFIFNLVKLKYSSSPSLALPQCTLCVCMCVCTCQLPCLFSSSVKECLFCFFRWLVLFCRSIQDIFSFCLWKVHVCLLATMRPATHYL